MTGGQNHPATGKTIRNEPTKGLDLKASAKLRSGFRGCD